MKYIRTKDWVVDDGIYEVVKEQDDIELTIIKAKYPFKQEEIIVDRKKIVAQADDIAELCDEIVLIQNDSERNIVYLQEAYDRIDEYHELGNYEPRLIGRIKVGLDKKAVAEWKENEQGLYDWILL